MIDWLQAVADPKTAAVVAIIMYDEIGHVAIGKKWSDDVCEIERLDPVSTQHQLLGTYFRGALKPPFNIEARTSAKFSSAFHVPMAKRSNLYDSSHR